MSFKIHSKYSFILLAITSVLLLYSLATTSVVWIEPFALGLGSKFPLAHWAGLSFLACLWYSGRNSKYFLAASFVLTLSYLYVVPAIIRVPVWISNSYYPFGESKLVSQTGHINFRPSETLVSYLNWPAFLCFASQFSLVTGIPDYFILKYFPLIIVAVYGILLVLIQKTNLKSSFAVVCVALLLAGFFVRQQYFGPQAISYILFLMGILIVSWLFFDNRAHRKTLAALLLFLLSVTTVMHPLSSLMLLVTLFALYLTYRFLLKKNAGIPLRLVVFSAVIWLGYQLFYAQGVLTATAAHLRDLLFGATKPNIVTESSRVVGSQAMRINFWASWAIVGLISGTAALSILWILKKTWKRRTEWTKEQEYSIFSIVLLALLGLFGFVGQYGATEAYQRAFFFGLVPLTFLCVNLLKSKPRLLVALLVVVIFLNIPAQYGGDSYRLALGSQLEGTEFLTHYSPENFSIAGRLTLYIRYFNPLKDYRVLDIGLDYPFTSFPNSTTLDNTIDEVLGQATYVSRSDLEDNFYIFYLSFAPLRSIDFDSKCDRAYDNGQFVLYKTIHPT